MTLNAWLEEARAYKFIGAKKQAKEKYFAIEQKVPGNQLYHVWLEMAHSLWQFGMYDEALNYYTKCQNYDETRFKPFTMLELAEIYNNIGVV